MEEEMRKWLDALAHILASAPQEATLIHTIPDGPRAAEKLDGLRVSRRARTLRDYVHTIWPIQTWLNGRTVFTLTEDMLEDLLLDRADEPCAKSPPKKHVSCG